MSLRPKLVSCAELVCRAERTVLNISSSKCHCQLTGDLYIHIIQLQTRGNYVQNVQQTVHLVQGEQSSAGQIKLYELNSSISFHCLFIWVTIVYLCGSTADQNYTTIHYVAPLYHDCKSNRYILGSNSIGVQMKMTSQHFYLCIYLPLRYVLSYIYNLDIDAMQCGTTVKLRRTTVPVLAGT